MDDGDLDGDGRSIHCLMAGGGTGGHVFPALAIADQLARWGHRVSWVGRAGGMEESLASRAGVDFLPLNARPWVGQGPIAKLRAAATLAASTWRGRGLVRRCGADVVLGTGGYVSTPAVLGARLAGRPAFLFEPNARAGAANRLAARWASGAFVAHEETGADLACVCEVSGIPVRAAFYAAGPLPSGPPHLLVLGGSQGALQINRLLPPLVRELLDEPGSGVLTVTHQTGRAHIDGVRADYDRLGVAAGAAGPVRLVPFIDDVAAAMARAHLVISRAGALATAELAAAGRPAILIPLLAAGAGHQRFNAERMERAGAARSLSEEALQHGGLGRVVRDLLGDRPRLESMSGAARSLSRPDAASRIAEALVRSGGSS